MVCCVQYSKIHTGPIRCFSGGDSLYMLLVSSQWIFQSRGCSSNIGWPASHSIGTVCILLMGIDIWSSELTQQ